MKRGDDVVLSGLTAASTNELAEVVLGGSIVIPAAFVFFGSLAEPAVAFISDELEIERKKAVIWLGAILFFLCQFPIFFLGQGVVDELDFWGGTFCLVLFAAIALIVRRAWYKKR